MPSAQGGATIDAALDQFLAEQRQRLSPRTFRNYEEVVELLRHSLDAWEVELPAARTALRNRDIRGFIDAVLAEGDRDLAWGTALSVPPGELDPTQWLRLAESREAKHPRDALVVYQRVTDEVLQTADRRAYHDGVRILKKAARAADAAGRTTAFSQHVNHLREQYRRRPTLIAMLDKARLG